jgi:FMN phosphatase YigB (HAD superfamily)
MTAVERPSYTAPHAISDRRLERVWEAVSRADVHVVTTDVFDTLLWRQVAEPAAAFALVGERLQQRGQLDAGLAPDSFSALRVEAELRARELLRESTLRVEVTLHEIYALLPASVFAGGATAEHALAVELEVEGDLLVPDLDVLALLLAARSAGKRVAAVSDTYFTEDHLRGLLAQPMTAELELDRLFVSCAHRLGKSGGLFEIALTELGVAPEQVVHLGDNEEADVRYPRELGIECHPFEQRPAALEAVMVAERRHVPRGVVYSRDPHRPGVTPELTALRGKLAARTEREALPAALRPYWDHGALVHGPVLTGFAEWVQEQAAALGVTRVHGFMREGAFLGELVDRAGEYLGSDVRSAPLWLNRAVLLPAAIGAATVEELGPLTVRRSGPTVARFLQAIGLDPSVLPEFAGHVDTSLDDTTTRLRLLQAIAASDTARAQVLEHAAAARERVVRYVLRELAGDERLLCLDLGWGASAQGLLGAALGHAGIDLDVRGLYLVLHRGAARRVFEGQWVRGFLSDLTMPGVDLLMRSPEVLEQICMPAHGSQVALGDDLEPVLEQVDPSPIQIAQAETVRDGVRAFQREWARYRLAGRHKIAPLSTATDRLRPILLRSVVSPTPAEVAAFGGWHHDENQGSDAVEPIADEAMAPALRHLSPQQLKDVPMGDLYWPFAIAQRIDPTWAELIDLASAGELPWEALAAESDTGAFEIHVAEGVGIPDGPPVGGTPLRNRFGLSSVRGTLRASAIQTIGIRLSDRPAVIRLDFVELRCHVQGQAEPVTLRLDPQDLAGLERINVFVLNPNVFVAHSFAAELRLNLTERVGGHVFRVDVQAGFATIAIGELLPLPGRIRNPEEAAVRVEQLERNLADVTGSLSWRITKPLRALKRFL